MSFLICTLSLILDACFRLQRKEDEEARAELLEIMGSSQAPFSTASDFSAQCLLAPSPVYRTLNPLPHDALFSATAAAAALITVQQAVAAVAAAASTAKSESAMIHGGDIENERSLLLQQQSATGSLS